MEVKGVPRKLTKSFFFVLSILGITRALEEPAIMVIYMAGIKIQPLGCIYDFFLGVHLLAFSVGYVVAYPIFSVGAMIMEKFALQICRFLES